MENKECEFNGWTNWETWNANLWMTNEEWSYKALRLVHDIKALEEFWIDYFEGTDDIETAKINFEEIFNSMNE